MYFQHWYNLFDKVSISCLWAIFKEKYNMAPCAVYQSKHNFVILEKYIINSDITYYRHIATPKTEIENLDKVYQSDETQGTQHTRLHSHQI